ncbi:MAG: class II fumarate hydratase [Planctomycetota bacterium]
MAANATRTEKDSMGEMQVPADALYGASTQRAVMNFPVSGRGVPTGVVKAYGMLKAACAEANRRLGKLDDGRAEKIIAACGQIEAGLDEHGGLERHFPVDIYQTGSGTSTNMNANEVIANLVCLASGAEIGKSKDAGYIESGGVHPNDHSNMGQSSNDTFPTAMHVAAAVAIKNELLPAVEMIEAELLQKSAAWDEVVKIGRTHLQDATPIRLGQEFGGYAAQMTHAKDRLHRALKLLGELALGGTAVGTGINTHKDFGKMVAELLSEKTEIAFREAANHCEAQHAKDAVVEVSGICKTIAVSISKIANDIRWMGSGPRCGIGELALPAIQPGSSIMPGKVNPVICESAVMVSCRVIGNDAAITAGGMGGVGSLLDLNVAMPMMADALMESIHLLAATCRVFTENLLKGLEPNRERCAELIEGSLAMCTSLAPVIGYDAAAALAKDAFSSGKTVRELAKERNLLADDELDRLLDPMSMTSPDA